MSMLRVACHSASRRSWNDVFRHIVLAFQQGFGLKLNA